MDNRNNRLDNPAKLLDSLYIDDDINFSAADGFVDSYVKEILQEAQDALDTARTFDPKPPRGTFRKTLVSKLRGSKAICSDAILPRVIARLADNKLWVYIQHVVTYNYDVTGKENVVIDEACDLYLVERF